MKTIVMGFYFGIGDFVSAVPIINRLLARGYRVVVVAGKVNMELARQVAFEGDALEFIPFELFSVRNLKRVIDTFRSLGQLNPDLVMVSPHAQRSVSSWKFPIMLKALKLLKWKQATIIGAEDDRLSILYDRAVPVSKAVSIMKREQTLHVIAGLLTLEDPLKVDFWKRPASIDGKFDLLIHPGASKDNKRWPQAHYCQLVEQLADLKICFLGLPTEIEPLQVLLGGKANVQFCSTTLADSLKVMRESAVVLTMDSGFSHIASTLGVRHIVLFGPISPECATPSGPYSEVLSGEGLSCRPCQSHLCRYGKNLCMELITPAAIAARVRKRLTELASQA